MSNKSTEPATPETEEMLTTSVIAVYNKNIPTKNIISDLRWFDGDRAKFED